MTKQISFHQLSSLAFRNAKKHWRQSLGSMAVVTAVSMGVVLFDGYMSDVKRIYFHFHRYEQMLGELIIEHKERASFEGRKDPWSNLMEKSQTDQVKAFLDSHSNVETSVEFLQFDGLIPGQFTQNVFFGLAYDIEAGLKMRDQAIEWNVMVGKPFHKLDKGYFHAASGLAEKLGCSFVLPDPQTLEKIRKDQTPIDVTCEQPSYAITSSTEKASINVANLKLGGVHDPGYSELLDRHILVPMKEARVLLKTDKTTYLTVGLRDKTKIADTEKDIGKFILENNLPLRVLPWEKHSMGDFYTASISFLGIFRSFIVTILFFIAAFSVWNSVSKVVRERSREIGTLRSLGFTPDQVDQLLLLEMMFLISSGLLVGFVIAVVFSSLLLAIPVSYKAGFLSQPVPFRISLEMRSVYLTAVVVLVSGLGATLIASRRLIHGKIVRLFDQSLSA